MMRLTISLFLLIVGLAPTVGTQERVAIGFGVDTLRSPNREIFQVWRAYLSSRPDSLQPSTYWSSTEQGQWPDFDLLRSYVYQGFTHFTVVQLAPAPGLDGTYVIRTLVAGVFDSAIDVKPLALFRVYATREEDRWVLRNALPVLTRGWKRHTIGHVTFVYPPAHVLNVRRAKRSATFVDSLAAAFQLTTPSAIGYYFTEDLTSTFQVMCLDFFPLGPDTAGGRSNTIDKLVFVGSSTDGEGYRHELAHIVLATVTGHRTARLVSEGLATWTGGSAGLEFPELLPRLKSYVQQHPDVTLKAIMTDPPVREGTLDVGYDGFAVLCEMLFEKGGAPAIRDLAQAGTGPDEVLAAAARLLDVPLTGLDAAWQRRVLGSP